MKEIIRTNDLVLLSRIESILNDAGIKNVILDGYTSNIEGNIDAIKRRIVVSDDEFIKSQRLIDEFMIAMNLK